MADRIIAWIVIAAVVVGFAVSDLADWCRRLVGRR
jgi:hypothetical protein